MIFAETALPGAYVVDTTPVEDQRGVFSRTFCQEEFLQHGLNVRVAQCSLSFNTRAGTLRGMHWQVAPRAEAKLVRCTRGAMYDVMLDLRPCSPTYCKWVAVELTAENCRAVYLPEGVAHGFLTLTDATEVFYQISEVYAPECARGVRWDDPSFGIRWPCDDPIISARDRQWPDFRP
jgi:dTDP-4-dehydrorhamnose 3,5-epimerase